MDVPRPEPSTVAEHFDAMVRGEVPTRQEFVCPQCAGPAWATVTAVGNVLSTYVSCPCSTVHSDGVPKWPGWERLLARPSPQFDANPLSLTRGGGARVGVSFGRQRQDETAPCPHCGAPLPSTRTKQCFVCGTDWHDPQNVVCRKNPEWNQFGLKWRAMYIVELCQDPAGQRYTRYRALDDGTPDPHEVFETDPHPGWQWVAWGHYGYAGRVATTHGEKFTFDAHGVWLTWDEVRGLHRFSRGELAWSQVPWRTTVPPKMPPM